MNVLVINPHCAEIQIETNEKMFNFIVKKVNVRERRENYLRCWASWN